IAITNRGLRRAPAAVMERLLRGGPVDARNVYFLTVPVFEAPAGPYGWLNQSVFIATAERLPNKVRLSIFEGVEQPGRARTRRRSCLGLADGPKLEARAPCRQTRVPAHSHPDVKTPPARQQRNYHSQPAPIQKAD